MNRNNQFVMLQLRPLIIVGIFIKLVSFSLFLILLFPHWRSDCYNSESTVGVLSLLSFERYKHQIPDMLTGIRTCRISISK